MTAADGTAGSTVNAADASGPNPPFDLAKTSADLFAKATKMLEEHQKDVQAALPGAEKTLAEEKDIVAGMPMATTAVPPKGPELPKDKPQVPQPDPIQAFGSAASVLGIIGSMLLKQPISTALNASASAMKARNAQDWTQYEAHYKEWKDATDLAYRQADFEQTRYHDYLELAKTNQSLAAAKISALAATTQNEMMLAAAKSGDFKTVAEIAGGMARLNDAMNAQAIRLQGLAERDRHNRAMEGILGGRQTAAQQKAQVMQQDAAQAVRQMKDLLGILGTTKKPVAGVGGLVSRGVETLKTAPLTRDLFPGDSSKVDLSAHDFESKLALLKAQLPQLLNKTGRVSNFERGQIDSALDALSRGSTDATAKQSIENAIKILEEKFGLSDEGKPIPEKAPVEGGAAPAAANPEAAAILDAILGGGR